MCLCVCVCVCGACQRLVSDKCARVCQMKAVMNIAAPCSGLVSEVEVFWFGCCTPYSLPVELRFSILFSCLVC